MIDGCNPFKIYWAIILPLSIPAMATAAIFSFIWTWEDFLGPLVYLNDAPRTTRCALALRMLHRSGQRRRPVRPAVCHVESLSIAADRAVLHHLPAPHHSRHCHVGLK